jgi:uncharacterized membrane protein
MKPMNVDRTVIQLSSKPLHRSFRIQDHYDLALLSALALALPLLPLLPWPLLRLPLGLAMALGAPGYALAAAIFPRKGDLDGVARAGLSFGLSVAALPLLALALDALPWGIRPMPIALSLAAWIVCWDTVALLRRWRLAPAGLADTPVAANPLGWWRGLDAPARLACAAGALALALVLAAGGYAMLAPDPTARTTEFYALGAEGLAENYPREVAPGQPMQVRLGIANREGADARYRVEARSGGELLAAAGPLDVADGATWQAPLRYSLPRAGDDQLVEILLFRGDDAAPYRQLRLWVNVRGMPS